ncbi:UDP-glucose 4-epimerase [candidate division MSBL1 archaeon SCGC-AAA259A05]|uniref:UDP-glucose 4-epimerase n=1 Tax=candidate division MSBL1 archaeon SCGC-AAA259A05 TaxID=1698259 RepID=A0A133UBU7_9EURY|nr:UDP-glucose 4-epimerase [candidate division MSBL1 archaeon SCGC-AAA259A05]
MDLKGMRIVVTGGAGFIGSHLVDSLVESNRVIVIDDLRDGEREFVHPDANLIEKPIRNCDLCDFIEGSDLVFHLAADPSVRELNPENHINQNFLTTYQVLEAMREAGVEKIAFASSSTVYGEAEIPTTVDHPTTPISIYGAMKLSSESLISSYCHTFGFDAWIYRFANVIGSRLRHGVIYDFIHKLRNNSEELEILGDGEQEKSYIYIDDCVAAMGLGLESGTGFNVMNIGTKDRVRVKEIARIVSDGMDLDPDFKFTGGDRGWKGDVPEMLLEPEKLTEMGWRPDYCSREAVEKATEDLLREI